MQAMECIVCRRAHQDETVEHIIPGTLGNIHYILPKGKLCSKCNNRFAQMENHVLSSQLFVTERKRRGLIAPDDQRKTHRLKKNKYVLFLLKMAYESMYFSKNAVWSRLDIETIRNTLLTSQNVELYTDFTEGEDGPYKSIPGWIDRWRLSRNKLCLEYDIKKEEVVFRFSFGKIRSKIRLPM